MISLSSCEDVFDTKDPGQNPDTEAQTYYMAIQIANTDDVSTRAGEYYFDSDAADYVKWTPDIFNRGLPSERAIGGSGNYAFIFDEKGDNKGNLLTKMIWKAPESEETGPDYTTAYETLYVTMTEDDIKDNLKQGRILIVLNASSDLVTKIQDSNSIPDAYAALKALTVEANTTDADQTSFLYNKNNGTEYFTMSSSMIVKTAEGTREVVPAVTGSLNFYKSRMEAKENPISLYVERLQAKHTLLFQQGDELKFFGSGSQGEAGGKKYVPSSSIIYDESNTEWEPSTSNTKLKYVTSYNRHSSIQAAEADKSQVYKEGDWKVNITGWAPNGLEKSEYLFKNLEDYKDTGTDYFSGWIPTNENKDYRNYWAQDLNYSTSAEWLYPNQYRKVDYLPVTESFTNTYEDYTSDNKTPILNYYYYSSLAKRAVHQYTPENTFNQALLQESPSKGTKYDNGLEMRVGTHIIVTAQLLINKDEDDSDGGIDESVYSNDPTDGFISNVKTKYHMNGIYWLEDAYKEYVGEYLAYWMLTDENQKVENIGPNDGYFYVNEAGSYRLAKGSDFDITKAYIRGGDGYVCITPHKAQDNSVTKIYRKNGERYEEILSEQFNKLVYEHEEYMAGCYNEGRMYYPIAIKHNTLGTTGATGTHGVVRNHWYFFTINKVVSPGTPVSVPDQPIIPNNEPEYSGLGVDLQIIDWHNVNVDTDVSGQRPRN